MREVIFTPLRIECIAGRSCSKIRRGATDRGSAGFELHLPPQEIQQLGQSHGACLEYDGDSVRNNWGADSYASILITRQRTCCAVPPIRFGISGGLSFLSSLALGHHSCDLYCDRDAILLNATAYFEGHQGHCQCWSTSAGLGVR